MTARTNVRSLLLAASCLLLAFPRATVAAAGSADTASIVATVNGDVVTQGDVDARARLFALTADIALSDESLHRLDAQISQQLIDDKLRLQQAQSLGIVIPDQAIADQIDQLDQRNHGHLRDALAQNGIPLSTLVDQLRAQMAWTQVLRQQLGDRGVVSPAEVDGRMAMEKAAEGKPEYEVSEIFVPISSPARAASAKRFADAAIDRLRSGVSFANMAAEFSQSEDALSGGDMGWVRASDLDDAVAAVVTQMPEGAISNPIRVPGGYAIVTLNAKRIAGRDISTIAHVRQAFFPFTSPLNPAAPTDQQKDALNKAHALGASAHDCAAVEAANKALGSPRPSDPGPLPIERLSSPAMKALLSNLPLNKPSQPLVSQEGIVVMMVCSRDQANLAQITPDQMADRIVNERVERLARRLVQDLERQGNIKRYGVAAEDAQD